MPSSYPFAPFLHLIEGDRLNRHSISQVDYGDYNDRLNDDRGLVVRRIASVGLRTPPPLRCRLEDCLRGMISPNPPTQCHWDRWHPWMESRPLSGCLRRRRLPLLGNEAARLRVAPVMSANDDDDDQSTRRNHPVSLKRLSLSFDYCYCNPDCSYAVLTLIALQ